MKAQKKQRLVVVGIRRKGERGFKIKSAIQLTNQTTKPHLFLKLA